MAASQQRVHGGFDALGAQLAQQHHAPGPRARDLRLQVLRGRHRAVVGATQPASVPPKAFGACQWSGKNSDFGASFKITPSSSPYGNFLVDSGGYAMRHPFQQTGDGSFIFEMRLWAYPEEFVKKFPESGTTNLQN